MGTTPAPVARRRSQEGGDLVEVMPAGPDIVPVGLEVVPVGFPERP